MKTMQKIKPSTDLSTVDNTTCSGSVHDSQSDSPVAVYLPLIAEFVNPAT